MAKKIVNVVYKVDDSELTKVKATIQQVAAETKKSETAMTGFNKSSQDGNIKTANTIAGMTLQMQQLKAQIELTKTTDTARLNQLKTQYQQVKAQVDAFNKSLSDTKNEGQATIPIFGSLNSVIAAAFSVAALKRVIDFGLEMNKLSGQIEGVDKGFRRAFPNATLLLEQLRKSTHGTITDFELMKRTLQATNLGVTAEHLGTLFEFAAARAQQTGESVDYLVDSIVRGVGRKSILVLDNLGISATRLREQFNGAAIASKSVAEVTAGVAEIAKVELQKMGGYVETSETKVKQLDVAWETLKQNFSKRLASSGFIATITEITQGFADATLSAEDFAKKVSQDSAIKSASAFIKSFSGQDASDQTREAVFAEINARTKRIEKIKEELKETSNFNLSKRRELVLERDAEIQANDLLRDFAKSIADTKKPAKDEVGYIQAIKDAIENLNTEIDAASRERLPGLQAKLDSLKKQLTTAQLLRPLAPLSETNRQNELKDLENDAKAEAQILADANETVVKNEEEFEKKLTDVQKEGDTERLKQDKAAAEEERDQTDRERQSILKIYEDAEKRKRALQQATQEFVLSSIDQIATFALINRSDETQSINDFYDQQIKLAGDNDAAQKALEEKRKKELDIERERQVEADKQAAITKIEIDTAVNIIRSILNNGGIPLGLPFGALAAAAGLIQIATVKSVRSGSLKTRAFKEGEVDIDGPGTSTSDSISAKLSRGESVINAQATASSKSLLEAINERKIDDSILSKLAGDGGKVVSVFDDRGIIKAIEENKVDYINQGYTLMKVERKGSNFKRMIRAKVQGYK